VRREDSTALAKALVHLIENSTLTARFAANGRASLRASIWTPLHNGHARIRDVVERAPRHCASHVTELTPRAIVA